MKQESHDNKSTGTSGLPPAGKRTLPLFSLGKIVATPSLLDHFIEHCTRPDSFIEQHVRGNWGDIPPEDIRENDFSVLNGFRVLSAYEVGGKRFWILTEADRSVTTLLFPEEY
ncbi:hypothetical protein [Propionivibrio sp.]|uniref:hypothetical protein n=1 Tax=Propionivibrio sp. TaxID=2212460 RepID=UPI0025D21B96|nr:hypothetical protein [Propionivibrio sp.]MBK7356156.1 hypothetical protein [Propionivibrio sp.]